MDTEPRTGLSPAAVVAIVCNSVTAVLIFILFLILCKACKVPSCPEKAPVLIESQEKQKVEQKYLSNAA
uniref:Adropin n=1 Tax=Electrophorus electricus TaxID=8005 RepID=A0A4W4GFF5_ELEEL